MWQKEYRKRGFYWGLKPDKGLKKAIKYAPKGVALDIGAGEGRNSIFLAKNGFRVEAIDKHFDGLKKCKTIAENYSFKISVKTKDITKFNFPHNKYSLIVSVAAIDFLKKSEIEKIYGRRKTIYSKRTKKIVSKNLAFCLMPNHYHLLLMPLSENSLPRFMKKINMGYAKYFNEKHHRTGTLFEGRYKLVPVNKNSHLVHLPYYIHLNPLDLIEPEWRKKELKNYKKAINFLKKYRWSSHLDYAGEKNFPSVTQRDFLLKIFGNSKKYQKEIEEWIKSIGFQKQEIQDVILEK